MVWKVYWGLAALATVVSWAAVNWLAGVIVAVVFIVGFIPFWGAVVILRPKVDKPYKPSPTGPPPRPEQ
ncbi:MAG: hypothetical protein ACQEWM_08490 [Actinomycetota bacterium]